MVHADFAWWTPRPAGGDPAALDEWRPNVNLLVSSDPPYDPAFGSTQMRGLLCRVYPAADQSDGPPAAATAFPGDDPAPPATTAPPGGQSQGRS